MQFNEFEYHFACHCKDVHLCFIMSPGKMIFAVLELTVTLTVSFKLISFYIYFNINQSSILPLMALNSLYCADVQLSNYSLTTVPHS